MVNVIDGGASFSEIANFAIALAIVIGTILSVSYIAWGGVSFIISGGDEEKIKAAVHTIRYSIVGLVVIFLSVLIIKVIGAVFDLDLLSYLTLDNVKGMIQTIVERLQADPSSSGSMNGVLD